MSDFYKWLINRETIVFVTTFRTKIPKEKTGNTLYLGIFFLNGEWLIVDDFGSPDVSLNDFKEINEPKDVPIEIKQQLFIRIFEDG